MAAPQELVAAVASTAAGRGSDDPQVLGSLWWQAYVYRVAGTTLAAWALTGAAPDPAAAGCGVGIARSRPSSLLVDPAAEAVTDLTQLVGRIFVGHLDPLADALRADHRLGTQLLWGNAAAGIGSVLGAVGSADGAPPIRVRGGRHPGGPPHDIAALGDWVGPGWTFQRTTCCLWWKTTAAGGSLCADCSLEPRTAERAP